MNYVGFGVAVRASDGQVFASTVFTESRDHTAPSARVDSATRSDTTITFTWHGYDPRLQTHWAGLRDLDVWYRMDGGPWRFVGDNTTATSLRSDRAPTGTATGSWSGPAIAPPTSAARAPPFPSGFPDPRPFPGRAECPQWRHASGRFAAVNLISDPIHGYIELTKRLAPGDARAGMAPEDAAEEDILDTAWLQRLRRMATRSKRPLGLPTAEHSRFTHGLGVMHEAGLWGRQLYPSLVEALAATEPGMRPPSEGLVVETLRVAGLLHDVGHGPFAHFFDEHVLAAFPAPTDRRRPAGKALTDEDLSQLDHRARARPADPAPAARPRRRHRGPRRVRRRRGDRPRPGWPTWSPSHAWTTRRCPAGSAAPAAPSGVFTVDNLDYVRRDAYFTGVSAGPVDAERLRRYAFISERGLTLYEPGLAALEMFLTARLFMYQQVYFHRTVRGIDLDLAEVFAPSIRAIFGDGSPADDLGHDADLDEYALDQAARWGRGEDVVLTPAPGDGRVAPHVAGIWRRRILLRRPRWRAEAEVRAEFETGPPPADAVATLGAAEPGRVIIDLAVVDARPSAAEADALLAIAGRDGRPPRPLADALGRLPAYALIGRRYVRVDGDETHDGDQPPRPDAHGPGDRRDPPPWSGRSANAADLDQVARAIARRAPRFVLIAARGTSDHAAIYARYLIETTLGIPAGLAAASVTTTTWCCSAGTTSSSRPAVSQSGAGPDVAAVVEAAREAGAPTLAITNEPLLWAAAAAEMVLLLAGEERAVAATKTYVALLAVVAGLVARLAAPLAGGAPWAAAVAGLPDAGADPRDRRGLGARPRSRLRRRLAAADEALVVSRGHNFATALEVALKLKETGRIFADGETDRGTSSMVP